MGFRFMSGRGRGIVGAPGLGRLGHGGDALRHHGDTAGHGLGQGGIGRHGGHLFLPQIQVTAGKRVEVRRRL
ncbi:hypothetical protein [Magnetospirillum sp. SS-4]|uniref:hypothetical protein n=1 Tax=Magnetospirillum sp. SS-4 TaxID=2681465 RepID=UPI001574E734|nr:hypothetical protein [Magnetospirillum sp. SS-4]